MTCTIPDCSGDHSAAPVSSKTQLAELRWLRGLVAERDGHGGDIPVWLALEWIDDAIKRTAHETESKPSLLAMADVALSQWLHDFGSTNELSQRTRIIRNLIAGRAEKTSEKP